MIRARFTWALAVICAGLWACGGTGGDGGGGGSGGGNGGTGGVGNAVCGNSVVEAGEDCDDGNVANGDGCDSTCQDEIVTPGACDNAVDFRGNASYDPSSGIRMITGTIERNSTGLLSGSCGGNGQEAVFAYATEAAGQLLWLVADPTASAAVTGVSSYILTSCDSSAEQACYTDSNVGQAVIPAAGTFYIVVDAADELDADLEFSLQTIFIPFRQPGEDCDPTGQDNMCVTGYVCKGDPATCQTGTAPVILKGATYFGGDPSYVIAAGTDEEEDVVGFYLEPIGADGQPMNIIDLDGDGNPDASKVYLDNAMLQQATYGMMGFFGNGDGTWNAVVPSYWGAVGLALWDPATNVPQARLTLVDAAGLESEPFTFGGPTIAQLGDACDNDGFVVCADGLLCKGTPGACAVGTAPVLTRTLYGPRPDGVVALAWEGTDVDDDIASVRFEMLDAGGVVIPFDYDADGAADPYMDIPQQSNGDTTFFAFYTVPEELASPQIALTPIDSLGLQGARVVLASTPVPVRAEGETCSPEGWDVCANGMFCIGDAPVCTDLRGDLCEAAPVIDVTAPGSFTAEGVVTLPSLWEPPTGCGGDFGEPSGTPEGIVVLKLANAATKVTISTNNDASKNGGMADGDTMVYLLPTACGSGTALGCNDDVDYAGGIYGSTLEVTNVPAGDYTIVVDTWYAESDGGAFQVDVTVQ